MLRATRLLASALFVISVSVLGTRVGLADIPVTIIECDNPPGTPSLCHVRVIGVEKRSNCELVEWWVQAKNINTTEHFKLQVYTKVKASVGPEPLCIEEATRVIELAPSQCASLGGPFFNSPEQPCDDPCCINSQPNTPERDLCLNCTNIIEATVKVIEWKPTVRSQWQIIANQPTVAAIANGAPTIGAETGQSRVINTCNPNDPHYRDWNLNQCQPGL